MIDIYLNGKSYAIAEKMTLKQLLEEQGIVMGTFAVVVNEAVINKVSCETLIIQAADRVEILAPMCGG